MIEGTFSQKVRVRPPSIASFPTEVLTDFQEFLYFIFGLFKFMISKNDMAHQQGVKDNENK